MSVEDAVGALKALGLPNYEARVFVALQRLGEGTAREVSDVSSVPRSQVYGGADELAERGLVEVVESSPKRYRPVSLDAARSHLTERIEREQRRAFEALESLRALDPEVTGGQDVSTLRGRQPIDERLLGLIEGAERRIVLVVPAASSLPPSVAAAVRDRAAAGVEATLLTAQADIRAAFEDDPVEVIVMTEDSPADFAGRALMIDEATILLAVATPDGDAVDEEAMWTADTSIGRILAQFMRSGMESGRDHR